jgi:lysozyme family protein
MADFKKAQEFVKLAEGGYGNDSRDHGNWTGGRVGSGVLIGTNHGISAPVLSEYLGRTATESDMRNLSYETALQIYKKNYWDALALSNLRNQSTALLIYDGAVNQGVGRMKGLIADSLSAVGISASRSERASSLIEKVNSAPEKAFYDTLKEKRRSAYNPNSYAYQGWMNRLNKLGFFLTEQAKQIEQKVRAEVKKNPIAAVVIILGTITAVTALVVYRKSIIKSLNK